MLNFAKAKHSAPGIEWQVADMMALPFADGSFDFVVCQFGMMFLPDKTAAMREARRVLKEDGRFVFNVWDSLEANELSRVAHETILSFFPTDPPRFYETPFGSYDIEAMRGFLKDAGFRDVQMTPVECESVRPSAHDAATGLVQGTPVVVAVKDRDRSAIPKLADAVAHALAREFGEKPCRARMRALVWEATR